MVSEGAKKAQTLGYNRSTAPGNDERNRTFYVLYFLEKNMSFNIGRCSTIMDSDISSAIPTQPLSCSGTSFDWTRASIRISRLLSRIYASLFSVSVRGRPKAYYNTTIHNLKSELGAWAKTIPVELRPGQPIRPGLEYASQGTLPGSIASEFTQIARTYVRAQNDSEKNSRPKSSPMYAGGVAPIEGLQETTVAEVSSAFPSYADLQPFPLGWNLRNDGGTMLDGESLDLFGSYYPLWDEGAAYNTMNL
ncbi:unnamed protein product [Alternaria alternata]